MYSSVEVIKCDHTRSSLGTLVSEMKQSLELEYNYAEGFTL